MKCIPSLAYWQQSVALTVLFVLLSYAMNCGALLSIDVLKDSLPGLITELGSWSETIDWGSQAGDSLGLQWLIFSIAVIFSIEASQRMVLFVSVTSQTDPIAEWWWDIRCWWTTDHLSLPFPRDSFSGQNWSWYRQSYLNEVAAAPDIHPVPWLANTTTPNYQVTSSCKPSNNWRHHLQPPFSSSLHCKPNQFLLDYLLTIYGVYTIYQLNQAEEKTKNVRRPVYPHLPDLFPVRNGPESLSVQGCWTDAWYVYHLFYSSCICIYVHALVHKDLIYQLKARC